MKIQGLQKLTLLDFPEHTACTVFLAGCNFRCPFCHNAGLVRQEGDPIPETEVLGFLWKRRKVLDGVCISGGEPLLQCYSGGEPLLQDGLGEFLGKVKQFGYRVKLDTNGSEPGKLKSLVKAGLIDYVAMDIKNSPGKYAETAGVEADLEGIRESVNFLLSGTVPYEFRTTVTGKFHTPEDFRGIGQWTAGACRYYLQRFQDSGDLVVPGDYHCPGPLLETCFETVKQWVPSAELRGI